MVGISKWWTNKQHQQLLDLAAQGLNAREIGKRLGCSRNAVIGRLFRARKGGEQVPDMGHPRPVTDTSSLTLDERLAKCPDPGNGCRFIIGNLHDKWNYCGDARYQQTSWCQSHFRIVFSKSDNQAVS